MKVLIDNGHGRTTPGKCSPDKQLLEWKWNRQIAAELKQMLEAKGIEAVLLVPEDDDIPLRSRVRRANAHGPNCLLVSIHANAAGNDGKWHKARGWSVFVAPNASRRSVQLATAMASAARDRGLTVLQPLPTQPYWVQSLAICRDTICPAILTENLFMDNREDCELLLDRAMQRRLAEMHAECIEEYVGACRA